MYCPRLIPAAAMLAATALLSGCFSSPDDSSPAAGSEEEAIQSVMFAEEFEDYTAPEVRWFDDGSGPALAPINTHRWRREVQSFERTVQITVENASDEPATASVVVTGEATGLLHLLACEGDELIDIAKDFADTGVRSLFFEKVRPHTPRHRGWKLQAVSGVEIESDGATRQINSVQIQAGDVDATITGVSELIALEDLLRLPAETEVTVTVDTGDATDAVFLHARHDRRRMELDSNGDGTFSGSFMTGSRPGARHIVVDVLSAGTLYDDTDPYDNRAWGYPFVIEGERDGRPNAE